MTAPLDLLLRSSAVLAITLAAAGLLRRRSAALRHCLLAGGLFAAGLVVPIGALLPAWTVSIARPAALDPRLPEAAIVAPFALARDLPNVTGPDLATLIVAWAVGVGIGVLALLVSLLRFGRLAARATPLTDGPWAAIAGECVVRAGVRRPVALLETTVPGVLATWGVLRPRILVPVHARGWSDARILAVLQHELAHIRRLDWFVQVAAEATRAVHWCNPLFWIACRRLRLESERACDDAVLRVGVAADDYAAHLVDIVRSARPSSLPSAALMPMARPSTLHRRVAAMLNTRLPRGPISGRATALVTVGLVCVALAIASVRAAEEGPHPLAGFVYDPTGAVLPGVTITLQDERANRWQTVSDDSGRFEFAPVSAGKYVLAASIPGFRALRQPIELRNTRDWTRAVTLQVGEAQESIVSREPRIREANGGASSELAPIRVGGSIQPPRKVRDVKPVYPRSMRAAGLEGVVPLEAIIARDGTVQSLRVLSAQVHPDFARAAMDAVRQWRFDPTLLNGKPVEVVMNVSVEFALDD